MPAYKTAKKTNHYTTEFKASAVKLIFSCGAAVKGTAQSLEFHHFLHSRCRKEGKIMKMVYSNENHFLVNNVKNLIEAQEINTFIKNEFAQGAAGEISPFDSWPEVWVYDDADFDRAVEIATSSQKSNKETDWICKNCSEKNDPSFEICWNCQRENL